LAWFVFLTSVPRLTNRTASATTALPATSPSTTLWVVPAAKEYVPSVVHAPLPPAVWFTFTADCPPAWCTVNGAFVARSEPPTWCTSTV
jgi:hypothetical protein